ncbi:protein of unknown function [Streptococcus thermophilus]|nr:protein of unknown function [Streptococcus thermophilus]
MTPVRIKVEPRANVLAKVIFARTFFVTLFRVCNEKYTQRERINYGNQRITKD